MSWVPVFLTACLFRPIISAAIKLLLLPICNMQSENNFCSKADCRLCKFENSRSNLICYVMFVMFILTSMYHMKLIQWWLLIVVWLWTFCWNFNRISMEIKWHCCILFMHWLWLKNRSNIFPWGVPCLQKAVFGKVSNVFWSANVKLVLYHWLEIIDVWS